MFARLGHPARRRERRAEIQQLARTRGKPALSDEPLTTSGVPCGNQQGHGPPARGYFKHSPGFDPSEMLARLLA